LCGYGADEALGKSPKELLHGEQTDKTKAKAFSRQLASDHRAKTMLINYDAWRRPFLHRIESRLVVDPTSKEQFYITESSEERDDKLVHAFRFSACMRTTDVESVAINLVWLLLFGLVVTNCIATLCASDEQSSPSASDSPAGALIFLTPLTAFESGTTAMLMGHMSAGIMG
jgi:hypothetical protein